MIADAALIGHLREEWLTLDATYGLGVFWKKWRPEHLVRQDLDATKAPDGVVDFRCLPYPDDTFDAVMFDPPYKLNGQPDPLVDDRYGVGVPTRWQDRMALCTEGIIEQARVLKVGGNLLVKCQDQVCSGRIRWQTDIFSATAFSRGCVKIDEMMLLGKGRKQPETRPHVACGAMGCSAAGCIAGRVEVVQRHAAYRPSTLLIFTKQQMSRKAQG